MFATKLSLSLLILTICMIFEVQSHVFKLGDCPEVDAMDPFNITEFEGSWYVLQKFNTVSRCIRENVTREGDQYYILEEMDSLGVPM